MGHAVFAEGLRKRFDKKWALDGFDLAIEATGFGAGFCGGRGVCPAALPADTARTRRTAAVPLNDALTAGMNARIAVQPTGRPSALAAARATVLFPDPDPPTSATRLPGLRSRLKSWIVE